MRKTAFVILLRLILLSCFLLKLVYGQGQGQVPVHVQEQPRIHRQIDTGHMIDGLVNPELIPISVMLRICLEDDCDYRDTQHGPRISKDGLKKLALVESDFHAEREIIRPHATIKDFDTYWSEVYGLVDQYDARLKTDLSGADYNALQQFLELHKAGAIVPKQDYRMPNSVAYREADNMVASMAGQGPPGMTFVYTSFSQATTNKENGEGTYTFANAPNGYPFQAGTTPNSTCNDGWFVNQGSFAVENGTWGPSKYTEFNGATSPWAIGIRWIDPTTCRAQPDGQEQGKVSWQISGGFSPLANQGSSGPILMDGNLLAAFYFASFHTIRIGGIWKVSVGLSKYKTSPLAQDTADVTGGGPVNVLLSAWPLNAFVTLSTSNGTVYLTVMDPANKYATITQVQMTDSHPLNSLIGGMASTGTGVTMPLQWSSAQTIVTPYNAVHVVTTVSGHTNCSGSTCNGVTHQAAITNQTSDGKQGGCNQGDGLKCLGAKVSPQTDINFSIAQDFFIGIPGTVELDEGTEIDCSAVGPFVPASFDYDWERTETLYKNDGIDDGRFGWETTQACVAQQWNTPPSVVEFQWADYSESDGVLPYKPFNTIDEFDEVNDTYVPVQWADYWDVYSAVGCVRSVVAPIGQPWFCVPVVGGTPPMIVTQWMFALEDVDGFINPANQAQAELWSKQLGDGNGNINCTIFDNLSNMEGVFFFTH